MYKEKQQSNAQITKKSVRNTIIFSKSLRCEVSEVKMKRMAKDSRITNLLKNQSETLQVLIITLRL